ncbi:armadillo-type protein [Mycena latifolia]|nr:armadillo-type protein [Mycena latifolia]
MPPLTRQRTLESVLSWWSDSNPSGVTINLHAVTKPLMRLMYHRQALGFMKSNNGLPLTPETLEIYWSYMSWKYVSTSTKLVILEELKTRARSEEDARVLINSNMVYRILEFLRSTSYFGKLDLRSKSEAILRILAHHIKSISVAVSEPLVALLRDSDVDDTRLVFYLLRSIAYSPAGAEGVVAANMLHYLLDGLGSPSPDIRKAACLLMETLMKHQSTAAAVIDLNPCKQLVAISSTAGTAEASYASYVLVAIANWPDGAEAAVAAHVLDHVPKWLASPDDWMYSLGCQLVENLARHKSTAGAVMDPKLCAQLVAVLELDAYHYSLDPIHAHALEALASIANWPNGAEAVVAAKALDHLTKLLVSRWDDEPRPAYDLLAALARHESTAQAVARAVPRERLVALLRDEDNSVRESARKALQALDNCAGDNGRAW